MPSHDRLKKIITAKGQTMWYLGDGIWFGRTSKAEAELGLATGKYFIWETVDHRHQSEPQEESVVEVVEQVAEQAIEPQTDQVNTDTVDFVVEPAKKESGLKMKFRNVQISGCSQVKDDLVDSLVRDAQRVMGFSRDRTGEFLEPPKSDDPVYHWATHILSLRYPVVRIWLHEPIGNLQKGEHFVAADEINYERDS